MNNKILEITKQLQELAAANPGLTIHLDEEELTVMIKNDDPVNEFIHELALAELQTRSKTAMEKRLESIISELKNQQGQETQLQTRFGQITKVNGHDWTAGQIIHRPQY